MRPVTAVLAFLFLLSTVMNLGYKNSFGILDLEFSHAFDNDSRI